MTLREMELIDSRYVPPRITIVPPVGALMMARANVASGAVWVPVFVSEPDGETKAGG